MHYAIGVVFIISSAFSSTYASSEDRQRGLRHMGREMNGCQYKSESQWFCSEWMLCVFPISKRCS